MDNLINEIADWPSWEVIRVVAWAAWSGGLIVMMSLSYPKISYWRCLLWPVALPFLAARRLWRWSRSRRESFMRGFRQGMWGQKPMTFMDRPTSGHDILTGQRVTVSYDPTRPPEKSLPYQLDTSREIRELRASSVTREELAPTVDALEGSLDDLHAEMTNLRGRVEALELDVEALELDASRRPSDSALGSRVESLEAEAAKALADAFRLRINWPLVYIPDSPVPPSQQWEAQAKPRSNPAP